MALIPPLAGSAHLDDLLAEINGCVASLAAAPAQDRRELAAARGSAAVIATLNLDGSPLSEADLAVLPTPTLETSDGSGSSGGAGGGWFDALRTDVEMPDVELQAREVAGVRAALRADDLAPRLVADPGPALAELHRRLTEGLTLPERAGAARLSDQAVHDGSTGRVVFFTPAPSAVPDQLARLLDELASLAGEHPVLVSGILHHELLRLHPFDAANGRLARAAARLRLRAGGFDPDGLGSFEPALARDAIGYHEEVARSQHRRDLTVWLERCAEALAEALTDAVTALGTDEPADVADRASRFLADRTEADFTLADYRGHAGSTTAEARAEMGSLLAAGLVRRVPASRGLRFTMRA